MEKEGTALSTNENLENQQYSQIYQSRQRFSGRIKHKFTRLS